MTTTAVLLRAGIGICLFLCLAPGIPASAAAPEAPGLLPGTEVLIDAGHGGIDGGTTHGPLLEKHINLEMARRVHHRLAKLGIRSAVNRTADYAPSDDNRWLRHPSRHFRDLRQRKEIVDSLSPGLVVSLHVNWSSKPARRGPIVLYQNNESSKRLANEIQQSLNSLYGTGARPVHGRTFYLLKHVACPAVIVEMGYLSNEQDRLRLTSPHSQEELADAIVSALQAYLRDAKKTTKPPRLR